VSNRFPRRVAEAYGGNLERARGPYGRGLGEAARTRAARDWQAIGEREAERVNRSRQASAIRSTKRWMRLAGIEPATSRSGGARSIP
jgi:hypothetical protein